MTDFTNVGKLGDFPEGEIVARKVGDVRVAVVRLGNAVYAYEDACPHAGYTLSGGRAADERVVCDVHGAVFDSVSGQALDGPADDGLTVFTVKLDGDDVLVARP